MSVASTQAQKFFAEIVAHGNVWAIRDSEGFPAPTNRSGEQAMPFRSLESRAQKVIETVPAYKSFKPYRLSLTDFVEDWLTGMEKDGLVVGINWSGTRALGYDMSPADVRARIAAIKTP